jgi:molecular chaperone GrpE (heat shock protein)
MKDSSAYTLFVSRKNSQDPTSTIKSAKKPKPDLEAKFNHQKVQTAALLRFINQIESTVAEDQRKAEERRELNQIFDRQQAEVQNKRRQTNQEVQKFH